MVSRASFCSFVPVAQPRTASILMIPLQGSSHRPRHQTPARTASSPSETLPKYVAHGEHAIASLSRSCDSSSNAVKRCVRPGKSHREHRRSGSAAAIAPRSNSRCGSMA